MSHSDTLKSAERKVQEGDYNGAETILREHFNHLKKIFDINSDVALRLQRYGAELKAAMQVLTSEDLIKNPNLKESVNGNIERARIDVGKIQAATELLRLEEENAE